MWHEARKQERKIRGMLVDYRKRAERRRDFYEKIKADPTQFLQLHGRQCKIHLDPAVAAAADSPAAMMPWQGQADNLIDRFDVRAHLDFIQPIKKQEDEEVTYEERQLNYERYRIIAQNSFLGISEEKFLKQLHLEEQFGYTETEPKKKKVGAAIGFNYDDNTGASQSSMQISNVQGNSSDENSDSDLDVDLSINVSKMDSTQAHEMNRHGRSFGMSSNDFYSFLTNDLEEAENYRLAKEEEHEKALFSGRKSRRERRAHREKRLANRVISPPSYAARTSPTYPMFRESKSASKSPSPENAGKITYITSFGDEDEMPGSSKPTYADKVKYGLKLRKLRESSSEHRTVYIENKKRSLSKELDRSNRSRNMSRNTRSISPKSKIKRSEHRYRRSRSKNRHRKYYSSSSSSSSSDRSKLRSRSSSRSKSRYKKEAARSQLRPRNRSYTRSRSVSRTRFQSRSKSRSTSKSKTRKSKSRSTSRSKNRSRSRGARSKSGSRSSSSSKSRSRSASRSKKSLSRSDSLSSKSSAKSSRSKSRSSSVRKDSPPKVLPRYYGRKRSDQSSSDSDRSSNEKHLKPESPVAVGQNKSSGNNSGSSTKKSGVSMSLQERLKRKRQALLNKQFKADKIAEQLKTEREKQEQQHREDELREMAIKFRRRQRERRHAYDSNSSASTDSESRARSPGALSDNRRSRSASPRPRREEREYKSRETRYRYHEENRERHDSRERDSSGRRSPKSRYDGEKRVVYRDEADRDRSSRRRDDYKKDHNKEPRRDDYKNKDRCRALVDY